MYSNSSLIHSAKLWHKKHSSHFSHPDQTVQHCQTVHSATVLQFSWNTLQLKTECSRGLPTAHKMWQNCCPVVHHTAYRQITNHKCIAYWPVSGSVGLQSMGGATCLVHGTGTEKSASSLSQYGHTEIIYISRYMLIQEMKLQIRTKCVYNMLADCGYHITFKHGNGWLWSVGGIGTVGGRPEVLIIMIMVMMIRTTMMTMTTTTTNNFPTTNPM